MFTHIMVPVDMAEKDRLTKAVDVAADLAKHHGARLTLISVSGGLQGRVSHYHSEYGRLLEEFAQEISHRHGCEVHSHNVSVPDPSVEVDHKLLQLIEELDIDLAVMATHQPGWVDHFVNSHGGRLARLAPISVFVVRDEG